MCDTPPHTDDRFFPSRIARTVVSLELIWPLPLLAVGVLGIHSPLLLGTAVVLALVPWPARLLVFGRLTRRASVGGALGLFVVSGFAGLWITYDAALSWPALLTLLGSVGFFFAVVNTAASPRRIAGGLGIVGVLVGLYFVGQYAYFGYPGEMAGLLSRLGRTTGSLTPDLVMFMLHPNAVAAFLEGVLLLVLALTWQERGGMRIGWGLATLVVACGLLISRSRGSWIGLAVAGGIGALLLVPNRWLRLALAGLGVFGILLGAYAFTRFVPAGQPVLTSMLETVGSRFVLYRNSFHLLGDYLFTGIGPGDTFAMVYSHYQLLIRVPFLTYPHNLFLSVGLGYGLLGLAALVWLLTAFYGFVTRVERTGLSRQSLPLFRAPWLGATATLVHGLLDSPQFSSSRWTMPMLFALLGLAVAAGHPALGRGDTGKVSETGTRRRRYWRWGAATLVVAALGVAAAFLWRPLVSAWYSNIGAVHQTWADLSPDLNDTAREAAATQAAMYYERALRLNPSQSVANRRLGMMALEQRNFEAAVAYLQQAYPHEPHNQATLKALGLASLWAGRLSSAEELLRQLDSQSELIEELNVWTWWWMTQSREDLSVYAAEMVQRLSAAR